MKSAGINIPSNRVTCIDNWRPDFHELADKVFETDPLPTAVLACNDQLAWAVIEKANEHGLKVPEDIAVTGFGDWGKSCHFTPPLTTVRVPWVDMFTIATKMLVEAIENSKILRQIGIKVEAELVLRQSV